MGILIICLLFVVGTICTMFLTIEIDPNKYNGWFCRWVKYIKCGSIHGHKYQCNRCIRCGKFKHKGESVC